MNWWFIGWHAEHMTASHIALHPALCRPAAIHLSRRAIASVCVLLQQVFRAYLWQNDSGFDLAFRLLHPGSNDGASSGSTTFGEHLIFSPSPWYTPLTSTTAAKSSVRHPITVAF